MASMSLPSVVRPVPPWRGPVISLGWQDGAVPTPQHCPSPRELADLELLTNRALTPITGFNQPGSPVTLDLPDALAGQAGERVDPEGLPLAGLRSDGSLAAL